jgi:alcohol dehydrogenase
MKMQAAVIHQTALPKPYAQSQPIHIEQVDLEGPGEGEVLVEIRAAGLCHSDLSHIAGKFKRHLPVVPGHEGAGIVREVGRGVKTLKQGDHVVMTVPTGCGHCAYCHDNKGLLCDTVSDARAQGNLLSGARRLSLGGKPLYHYAGISSFAEYAVTEPNALVKIDPAIPLDIAALFGCAVTTGAGCVLNAAKIRPGQSVAIFGLGGVGLTAVMAAKLAGASEIIGIDTNPDKFPLATILGCTQTFSARDPDLTTKIRDLTEGGVDAAFEIAGSSAALAQANAITRKAGQIICVGVPGPADIAQLYQGALVVEEKTIRGSLMGSGVPHRDIPRYLKFFGDGRLPVGHLMSGTITFADLNHNFDLLDQGAVLRQVLLPHG